MQYPTTIHRWTTAFTVVLALAAAPCFGQFMFSNMMQSDNTAEQVDCAKVDWSQEFIYAAGKGVIASDESDTTRAYQKAQGEAKMKAVANLLDLLQSTPVNYKAVGSDYIGKDSTLRDKIEERLAGVEVVNEKQVVESGETMVKVTVRAPMYGTGGVGSAVLNSVFQYESAPTGAPMGLSVEKNGDTASATTTASPSGSYTSLIVDCSNIDLERALNPKLRGADGSEFWGTPAMGASFLQNHGAVTYADTLNEAKRLSTAGGNPLVIQAVGRAGGRFMCDAIISDADAELVSKANDTSGFLNRFDVIFVTDPE